METLLGWTLIGTALTVILGFVLMLVYVPLLMFVISIVLLFTGAPLLGIVLGVLSFWSMTR